MSEHSDTVLTTECGFLGDFDEAYFLHSHWVPYDQ